MSAQCWCFTCAGKVVGRKTYVGHGRKDKPDAPIAHPQLAVLSMPDSKDALVAGSDESDDDIANNDSDSDHDPFGLACAWFWTPLPGPSPL